MRIAIASEENKGLESAVAHHFGRCPYYVFAEVEEGVVKKVETKENPFFASHEPGVAPRYIANEKANVIIAGGMGPRAIDWFERLGVKAVTGTSGTVGKALDDYLSGKLTTAESCNEHKH
ncbi:MAG: NifB/NifX family molybdenum-iron cluster-binding protein [Elusimicrobia bacterium]|nr:NifB/NifX family molybdenum-iron cluster-binding protein [Elusimicrobiota bacterium]